MVEGVGDHCCEYMTGGVVVVLGNIGANFGAGMTGGMAYLYDPEKVAQKQVNLESLLVSNITIDYWETQLKSLIKEHVTETASIKAIDILENWDIEKNAFIQICPKEMLVHLPFPISDNNEKAQTRITK